MAAAAEVSLSNSNNRRMPIFGGSAASLSSLLEDTVEPRLVSCLALIVTELGGALPHFQSYHTLLLFHPTPELQTFLIIVTTYALDCPKFRKPKVI